jgi:hypothetical protein
MIAIDIKCSNGHLFEGWFADSNSFKNQKEKLLVNCPLCGSSNVERMPSSFAIGISSKSSNRSNVPNPPSQDEEQRVPILPNLNLMEFKDYLDKNFEDVGAGFAEEALKIHFGLEEERNIRGITTEDEEKELKEEGVPFVKIPIIKFNS